MKGQDIHDAAVRLCVRALCMAGFVMTLESLLALYDADSGPTHLQLVLQVVGSIVLFVGSGLLHSFLP